jgi:dTDP-4-amino-4,6-dideoxygalactose transaminase
VNSGTNAVWVALRSLELEPFGEVIVPPVSDPGGVMPIALNLCAPVPADTAPGRYTVSAETIEQRITEKTRAIVVAHIAGEPAEMGPIVELARRHALPLLEDCAQAHGASWDGRPIGTFGDVAAFSLMFGKHHATGGQGGMVFCRDEQRYHALRRHADRGKPFGLEGAGGNVVAALNCNLDELHSAIGRVQLRKLPQIIDRRRKIARRLAELCQQRLQSVRLVRQERDKGEGVYWFVFFELDAEKLTVDKTRFVEAAAAEGIPFSGSYYIVPAEMPWSRSGAAFGSSGLPWSQVYGDQRPEWPLPNARATDERHFRLLIHEDFSDADVEDIVAALEKVERHTLA